MRKPRKKINNLALSIISLIICFARNVYCFGVVIYLEQAFYEPNQAKLTEFRSIARYPAHLKFTDDNNLTFELFSKNKPDIIEAETESSEQYEMTVIKIRKAKETFPQLANHLDSFEKHVKATYEKESIAKKALMAQQASLKESLVPTNATTINYSQGGSNCTSFLWTNQGKVNLDEFIIDGDKFKNVIIKSLDHKGILISHQDGSKSIKWKDTPNEVQIALGHDPNAEVSDVPEKLGNEKYQTSNIQNYAAYYIPKNSFKALSGSALITIESGKKYPIVGARVETSGHSTWYAILVDTQYGIAPVKAHQGNIIFNLDCKKTPAAISVSNEKNVLERKVYNRNPVCATYSCHVSYAPQGSYVIYQVLVDGEFYGEPQLAILHNLNEVYLSVDLEGVASDAKIISYPFFFVGSQMVEK
jgi:hypothetical protein